MSEPTTVDANSLNTGDKLHMAIRRAHDWRLALMDSLAIGGTDRGYIDIAALSVQNDFNAQEFEIVEVEGGVRKLRGGTVVGGAEVVNTATLRTDVTGALDLALTVLIHLTSHGIVPKDDIHRRLVEAKLIDA